MFLTAEENRKLTQVGLGTPGGELLRRYWHPVAGLHQLTDEQPTSFVRLLGEDLVLFRDKSGNVGLIQDHCAHRGASLLYGRVEERGISCAYHGWLYDTAGNCLETPAEPADSKFYLTVKLRAYPVSAYLGMYWAYLGPAPVPPIRRVDVGAYPVEHIMEMSFEANWVQVVENNMDGMHIGILHQDTTTRSGSVRSTTRGITDEVVSLEYREVPFGIQRTMATKDSFVEDDPLVFPNMLRRITEFSIKVPIDDTHTRKFVVFVAPEPDGARNGDDLEPVDYFVMAPDDGKSGVGRYPDIGYRMNRLRYQDLMAIETQGQISDRSEWHPGTSDRGVALYERMLLREMDRVAQGHDPVGVVRDPSVVIDTNFEFNKHAAGMTPVPQGVQVYARRHPALSS